MTVTVEQAIKKIDLTVKSANPLTGISGTLNIDIDPAALDRNGGTDLNFTKILGIPTLDYTLTPGLGIANVIEISSTIFPGGDKPGRGITKVIGTSFTIAPGATKVDIDVDIKPSVFSTPGINFTTAFASIAGDAAAEKSAAEIVYNPSNGKLFFNPNGTTDGFGAGGNFATFSIGRTPLQVNQTTDNGKGDIAGTLSYAILQANNTAGDDTIVLNNDVRLTGEMQALIDSNISIVGNNYKLSGDANANGIVDAGDVRPLFVQSGTVGINNLKIANGLAQGDTSVYSGAGAGMGGGLFIYDGAVSLNNVTLESNKAQGGNTSFFAGAPQHSTGVVGIGGTGTNGADVVGRVGSNFGNVGGNNGNGNNDGNPNGDGGDGVGGNGGDGGNGGSGRGGKGGITVAAPAKGGNGFGGDGGFGGNGGDGVGGEGGIANGMRGNGGSGFGGGGGFGGTGGVGTGGVYGGIVGDTIGISGGGSGGYGGFGGGGGAGYSYSPVSARGGNGGFGGGGAFGGANTIVGDGGFGGGNGTTGNNGAGGGGAGFGGAIFIRSGSLSLTDTSFFFNKAIGGGASGQGLGGAIFAMNTTTNTNGNNKGMPTTLPTVTSVNTTRYLGNTASDNFYTNDVYGTNINGVYRPTRRNDFNGDGKSDILWRSDIGGVALWQMNGATVAAANLTSTPQLDPSWKTAGTGDFNGDGKSDILWRNTSGAVVVWKMDGKDVISSQPTSTPQLDPSWKTAGTGDFNGDGKSDILWRNDDGGVVVWTMDGSTVTSSDKVSNSLGIFLPPIDNSWKVNGTGDFNGDGKSDILWRNDDGSIALWQMNGSEIAANNSTSTPSLDGSWKINGTADFNDDGKSDILWRNSNTGAVGIWQMNGTRVVSSTLTSTPSLDSSWTINGTGDFSGDGKADILWRKDTGALVTWEMNGVNVVSSTLTSIQPESTAWKVAAPIF